MPKYKVRKFKEPTFDQFTTLLARLTPEQLKHVQDISRHFEGEDMGFGNDHRTPYKKVLPGVWKDIQAATSGAHLVGGLVSEHFEHRDNPNFHRGGGLMMAIKGLRPPLPSVPASSMSDK